MLSNSDSDDDSYNSDCSISTYEFSDDDVTADESENELPDQWCKINSEAAGNIFIPSRFTFTGKPGLNLEIASNASSPLDFLKLIVDDELVQQICEGTNENARNTKRNREWQDTNPAEIHCFFALKILQGIVQKPEEDLYWSDDPMLQTPYFNSIMSLERYKQIKKFLSFASYSEQSRPSDLLLDRIENFHFNVEKRFKTIYTPKQNVTIDDCLLNFRCRRKWTQYIPLKHSKFDFKYYMLCESDSGYVWSFMKDSVKETKCDPPEYFNLPNSSKIVMTIMKPLLNKGYCVTLNQNLTSPSLADMLLKQGTDVYGTMKINKLPHEINPEGEMKRGEMLACRKDKLMAMRWKGHRDMALLSSIHSTELSDKELKENIKVPKLVSDFKKAMKGNDGSRCCGISQLSSSSKNLIKYFSEFFFQAFDLALWNAFVLYQKSQLNISPLDFKMKVIEGLIEKYFSEVPHPVPSNSQYVSTHSGGHFLTEISQSDQNAPSSRNCVFCARKRDVKGQQKNTKTKFMCDTCSVPLCAESCFKSFHSR